MSFLFLIGGHITQEGKLLFCEVGKIVLSVMHVFHIRLQDSVKEMVGRDNAELGRKREGKTCIGDGTHERKSELEMKLKKERLHSLQRKRDNQ